MGFRYILSHMIGSFLKFVRFPNLIIVGLTQYLLLYCLLVPFLVPEGIGKTLDHLHFFLFVLDTIIITLSGNIINDIEDYEIDIINRPDTVFVSKHITVPAAMKLYWSVVGVGFLLALYLAFYVDQLPLVLIYPFAVALLYFYSTLFKKKALIGNLVVSIFCGGVAGIILFAEKDAYSQLSGQAQDQVWWAFAAYAIFAFLTTLFRELVKDIEDMEGDEERGCKTLPIVAGVRTTKGLSLLTGLSLMPILLMISWIAYNNNTSFILWLSPIILVALPMIYLIVLLIRAKDKKDYHQISTLMKGIMLMGLLYLPLFYFLR